jgi:hypothetical protein
VHFAPPRQPTCGDGAIRIGGCGRVSTGEHVAGQPLQRFAVVGTQQTAHMVRVTEGSSEFDTFAPSNFMHNLRPCMRKDRGLNAKRGTGLTARHRTRGLQRPESQGFSGDGVRLAVLGCTRNRTTLSQAFDKWLAVERPGRLLLEV